MLPSQPTVRAHRSRDLSQSWRRAQAEGWHGHSQGRDGKTTTPRCPWQGLPGLEIRGAMPPGSMQASSAGRQICWNKQQTRPAGAGGGRRGGRARRFPSPAAPNLLVFVCRRRAFWASGSPTSDFGGGSFPSNSHTRISCGWGVGKPSLAEPTGLGQWSSRAGSQGRGGRAGDRQVGGARAQLNART